MVQRLRRREDKPGGRTGWIRDNAALDSERSQTESGSVPFGLFSQESLSQMMRRERTLCAETSA